MRFAGAVLIASALALQSAALFGLIVPPDVAQAQNAKAAKKKAPAPKAAPVPQPGRDVYPGMPLADRVALQFDLAWSGHYNGLINGEFSDRAIAAVRAFQKDYKFKETGVLAPSERAALASLSKSSQDQVGWRMVDDPATGAQVGLPTNRCRTPAAPAAAPAGFRRRARCRWRRSVSVSPAKRLRPFWSNRSSSRPTARSRSTCGATISSSSPAPRG
jgi:hypothetical protein